MRPFRDFWQAALARPASFPLALILCYSRQMLREAARTWLAAIRRTIRSRALGLLALSLCLVGCGGWARSARASVDAGGARIAFESEVHDFGTVTEGDKLRYVFVMKNPGNAPLLISGAHASCGCTVAALRSNSIAPGGTGEIDATFDTHNRVGPSRTTITVDSNATGQAHVTVTLTANVERMLALEQSYVRVVTEYGVSHVDKVLLTGKLLAEATPKILKLESPRRSDTPVDADKDPILDALEVRLIEEKVGDTVKKGLQLKLKGNKVAAGSGKVTIATGLAKPEQLELNLTWAVTSTLQVVPDRLSFTAGSGDGHERELRVSSKKPNFKLLRVRVLDGPFAAAIEKPEANAVFKVKVTWNGTSPGKQAEPGIGKLQLISNDPAEPKKVVELKTPAVPVLPSPPPARR